ncbi:transcription termination/antitermination NusG family protein [Oscillatoria amoena NRMC-F 0135]|nr:transcription termination/antitermination NusG family protein [Oscillatoria laete-virens]MDL5051080.1 transcription termination/antitermination NusG family protein [Oscillatoria amoena NRMC-F 0135]MDL5054527.1 transcription termination/antitermination NusG family protein [Oscillatoria laete-virens NRMC-F 0139]
MVAFNHDHSLPWFCLRTRNKNEHLAAAQLNALEGVDVFAPRIRYRKATVRGARIFVESLFPGYIFAQFDPAPLLTIIRSSPGVTGMVRFGAQYATVPPAVVEELRLCVGHEEIRHIEPALQPGDEVTVTAGAFKNLKALVTGLVPAKERVRILFDILGRPMEVELPVRDVTTRFVHPLVSDHHREQGQRALD